MTIAYFALQNTTAPANTSKTWNDVRKNTTGLGLVDDAGASTGWAIGYPVATNSIAGNGANDVGTGDAAWVDEAVIMYEGHYFGDDVAWMALEITGLDNANTYDLALTASQPVDRKTEVRVNGGTSQVLNDAGIQKQTDDVIFFNGVAPSSGKITIEYRSVTGSSAYLMAGYIDEVGPPPASVSVSGSLQPGDDVTGTTSNFSAEPTTGSITDSAGNALTPTLSTTPNGDQWDITLPIADFLTASESANDVQGLLFGAQTVEVS